MDRYKFSQTTIGADFNKGQVTSNVDMLLDYILSLRKLIEENKGNHVWEVKYGDEIEATKEVLKIQTSCTDQRI